MVIVDPFAGTSSTGVAALRNGCYYIGVEKDLKCLVRLLCVISLQHIYYTSFGLGLSCSDFLVLSSLSYLFLNVCDSSGACQRILEKQSELVNSAECKKTTWVAYDLVHQKEVVCIQFGFTCMLWDALGVYSFCVEHMAIVICSWRARTKKVTTTRRVAMISPTSRVVPTR